MGDSTVVVRFAGFTPAGAKQLTKILRDALRSTAKPARPAPEADAPALVPWVRDSDAGILVAFLDDAKALRSILLHAAEDAPKTWRIRYVPPEATR